MFNRGPVAILFKKSMMRPWSLAGCTRAPTADPGLHAGVFRLRCPKASDWPEYLRDQAAKYRQLAEKADDPVVKNELLELASVCEDVADNIEDHLTGG